MTRGGLLVIAVAAAAMLTAIVYVLADGDGDDGRAAVDLSPSAMAPAVPGCDAPPEILVRTMRGHFPGRSPDVVLVEAPIAQFGQTRHSSPYDYTQRVPLVFYGPGHVQRGFTSAEQVTLADVAPTLSTLMAFDGFDAPDGRSLDDALVASGAAPPPSLIVVVVWDGGGRNVLERWPEAWPVLKRLAADGASFTEAVVGSSPSITPSVHATLGSGAFPATHGMSDRYLRIDDRIVDAWEGEDPGYPALSMSPRYLEAPTLADVWDRASDNVPLAGLIAWDAWHVGMLGHGAFSPGGDHDVVAIHEPDGVEYITNADYYSLPGYLSGTEGLDDAAAEVDRADGRVDGRWLREPVDSGVEEIAYTPAWSIYQTDRIVELWRRAGFGDDDVTDLFFTNYKSTDLSGHKWGFGSPEVRELLAEQDRQLGELVGELDDLVGRGNYVVVVTADHGMTARPETSGRWPIGPAEVTRDVNRHFVGSVHGDSVIVENRGIGLFLDELAMRRHDVTAEEVAAYLRGYRLRDNVASGNPLLARYRGLEDQPLFALALTRPELRAAVACATARGG